MSTGRDQERAAECQSLISEIMEFSDELNEWETKFIEDIDTNLTKYGQATHISDAQYKKIQEIYERVC